jgi:hypothetical protein
LSDYFDRLETQLRGAAERPPRRLVGWGNAARLSATATAMIAAVGVSVALALALAGGDDSRRSSERAAPEPAPVGTVIPKGEGNPPRESRSTVVATGMAPVAGPWQLEVSRGTGVKNPKTGQVYLRAGGACLMVVPLDAPNVLAGGRSGYCGPTRELGFKKTPGFSRAQHSVAGPARPGESPDVNAREVLVFGVVPKRATAVVITVRGTKRFEVKPQPGPKGVAGDFYLIPVKPGLGQARINWIDQDGNEGSRGIALMPPVTDR